MNRKEFEATLTEICKVDLSKIKGIHPSMDNCKETFYIKDGKYRFEIKSNSYGFEFGIAMPEIGLEEEVKKDYITEFCNAVANVLEYVNGTDYIGSLVSDVSEMDDDEAEYAIAGCFFFKILLNFALNHLMNTVAERCL